MGTLHTRDVVGNHFKDRSFRLARRSKITLFSARNLSRLHQLGHQNAESFDEVEELVDNGM